MDYMGYTWRLLDECDIARICEDLDCPEIISHMQEPLADVLAMLVYRHQLGGSHAMLVAFDEQGYAVGWTGLVGNCTSTYLNSRAWGTGLNLACKSILWHLGICVLGYDHLIASVDQQNSRSLAACRKVFAGSTEYCYQDNTQNRISVDFRITEAPVGSQPMSASALRDLELVAMPWERV